MKPTLRICFPFRFEIQENGQLKRIFDESKAGIDVTFHLTIEDAESFSGELDQVLKLVKDFIKDWS